MDTSSRSKSILLVEHHSEVRAVIREALQDEGYEVSATPDVEAALPLVPHLERLDLILLEWSSWDDASAERLIQCVRRIPSHATVPIILLGVERHAPLPGAQGVLLKPFPLEMLLATVEASCR